MKKFAIIDCHFNVVIAWLRTEKEAKRILKTITNSYQEDKDRFCVMEVVK